MKHEVINIQPAETLPEAKLTTYFHGNSKELFDGRKRPCIIICPGGGYEMTSDREGEGIALKYLAMGYHAAILWYTVAPEASYPTALLQLAAAVALVRERAAEWFIDRDKICVAGFSAGGHLAASFGNFWTQPFVSETLKMSKENFRPNAQILSYPVISAGDYGHQVSFINLLGSEYESRKNELSLEHSVNENTPKSFLWHCATDESVPVENSLLFVWQLQKHHIPVEFHMYGIGEHGIGTAGALSLSMDGRGIQKECENWMELSHVWLKNNL